MKLNKHAIICMLFYQYGFAANSWDNLIPSQQTQQNSFNQAVNTGGSYNANGSNSVNFNTNCAAGDQSCLNKSITTVNNNNGLNSFTNPAADSYLSNGTVNSQTKNGYDNIKGSDSGNVNNSFYNQAQAQLKTCKSANDPACQAVTKYNDADTQQSLQQNSMGTSSYYFLQLVKADPSNTSCSIVTTYKPVNPQQYICQVGNKQTINCTATLSAWQEIVKYRCDPTNGGCNTYINDSLCQQTASYVPRSCSIWQYTIAYGCTNWGNSSCSAGGSYNYPGNCGTNGGTAACDGVVKSGKAMTDGGNYNCTGVGCAGKDWNCTNYNQAQLAEYTCKVNHYSYDDRCANYR